MTASALIAAERTALLETLQEAGSQAPTLCEGWESRHLLAHLLLRESKPLVAAGVLGGPLGVRTDRLTKQLADQLANPDDYRQGLKDFAALPGYLGMRTRFPRLDRAMNLLEYFVHTEDIRRAGLSQGQAPEPRQLAAGVEQALWKDLQARAKAMAGKKYPEGLLLEAPGYSPAQVTVVPPAPGQQATVLTGQPGELALYLFGRQEAALVSFRTALHRSGKKQ